MATLVASGGTPGRVFEKVTEEVGRLLGMPGANVMRYDGERTATVVGAWSEDGEPRPPGRRPRSTWTATRVVAKVLRTGSPQRVDRYEDAGGTLAETLQRFGYGAGGRRAGHRRRPPVGGAGRGDAAPTMPLPRGLEHRLCDFAELVAQALANADAHEQLAASRARLVEAGDAERRRLERNLHDGAQQRLVSVAVEAAHRRGGARARRARGPHDPRRGPGRACQGARRAARARARHPSRGPDRSRPRARARRDSPRARRCLSRSPSCRRSGSPGPVEAAAYYVVAEAITNVAKYANASSVTVSVSRSNGRATVVVSDDGVGGADPAQGTGLRGLADRLEALDGRLVVDSPAQRGTRISAEIPTL